MEKKQAPKTPYNFWASRFVQELDIAKGRAAGTIKNYEAKLRAFGQFIGFKNPEQISKEDIWRFRVQLNSSGLDKKTQSYYLIALRGFLKFLQSQGLAVLDPSLIDLPKLPERKIETLEEDELARLLDAASGSDLKSWRDQAILETLFSTGLRVSELCSLNRDLNLDKGEVSVRGKGSKVRVVFLSPHAKVSMRKYLDNRANLLGAKDTDEALFVSLSRNQSPKRITSRGIQKIIKFYAKKAGILKEVHPHTLRHQFATDLLKGGADLRSVQMLLGHKNLSTSQIYLHLTDRELKKIHQQFHGQLRQNKKV